MLCAQVEGAAAPRLPPPGDHRPVLSHVQHASVSQTFQKPVVGTAVKPGDEVDRSFVSLLLTSVASPHVSRHSPCIRQVPRGLRETDDRRSSDYRCHLLRSARSEAQEVQERFGITPFSQLFSRLLPPAKTFGRHAVPFRSHEALQECRRQPCKGCLIAALSMSCSMGKTSRRHTFVCTPSAFLGPRTQLPGGSKGSLRRVIDVGGADSVSVARRKDIYTGA